MKIIPCAGQTSAIDGTGVVLVGSILNNGDEIICTSQGHSWLVRRNSVADSILSAVGV